MNNHKLKKYRIGFLIFSLLLLVVLVLGCAGKGGSGPYVASTPAGIEQIFQKELVLFESPSLNKPVGISFTVQAEIAPKRPVNGTVKILLPEGFELVAGNLSWSGEMERGEVITLNATIKAVKTGDWTIEAVAKIFGPYGGHAQENLYLYVTVGENSATVTTDPFTLAPQAQEPPKEAYRPLDLNLALSGTPFLNNTVELNATVVSYVNEYDPIALHFNPKNTTITIFLPDGFELVEGDLVWDGDLSATKQVQMKAKIKAVKIGDWDIIMLPLKERPETYGAEWGWMDAIPKGENAFKRYGKGGILYIRVFNDTALVSEKPLPLSPAVPGEALKVPE
ncbi:MAG: hypothetical protein HYW26_00010 [Candidatus Aenigmarchaeota archaeon]|nr:hypothetical protein [Candidatus Aenigmarchaeota archaeon]